MNKIKASFVADLCGGRLIGDDVEICNIVRDNREINGGEMFVAISGEKFDGHDFAPDAASRGASVLLVNRELSGVGASQIVVDDTIKALGDIAKGYLESFDIKRVCVTGSVGKTTTKEMCAAMLSESFVTHKTQGNYNNNIGLPLTIFGVNEDCEAAVFEIGTNHFGEILPLTMMAKPHVALITTIGSSHLEAFGTKEGVLREKTEIFKGLVDDGVCVLNGDDPLLWGMREKIEHKTLWFGLENPECDVLGAVKSSNIYETVFTVKGSDTEFVITCAGEHNVRDALSAIAVGRALGMADSDIAKGLVTFKNAGMRQDIYDYNGITIIRDCYNANPDSMKASISLLGELDAKARICVLGDMLELGENAPELHREIGEFASGVADSILVTGAFSDAYVSGSGGKAKAFEDKKQLSDSLSEIAKKGDVVLVKGSYGTKMWQVLEYLQEKEV